MKKILFFLLVLPFIGVSQTVDEKIASLANDYLNGKPGALVIGIRKNGINKVYYFGETKEGNKTAPGNSSLFEIGELTEILTTALYSELAFDNVIDADDPLQKHLPKGINAPQYLKVICEPLDKDVHFDRDGSNHMTITPYVCRPDQNSEPQPMLLCYLANHTSGLPEMPDNVNSKSDDPFATYTADDLYKFLKGYEIINKVEYSYKHSSLGMGVLAHIIELKSGKTYNDFLNEKINQPLGLTSTYIYSIADDSKLLSGYNNRGSEMKHLHYGALGGAKGVSSNLTDMMKLMEVNLLTEKSHLATLFDYNQKGKALSNSQKDLALGWRTKNFSGNRMLYQKGKTNGFASYMSLIKNKGTGIVILSSVARDVDHLGEKILEEFLK